MKKLINDPYAVVDEMIEGFCAAHPALVRRLDNTRGIVARETPVPGKVGVLMGGGSGHEPAFLGYVGRGCADGVAIGNVFAAPPPGPILAVTRAIDGGAGVLYVYGNYAGDVLNFDLAAEMAAAAGIEVRTVRVSDDVASAGKGDEASRRGIAGGFFVYKVAGARAREGASLDEVAGVARKANDRCRSMGVALSPCIVPAAGEATFTLGDDEMEIGMGVHGEPGIRRGPFEQADAVATSLMELILADMPLAAGDEVAVLVNGLGATPLMELYILHRRVARVLAERGITLYRSYVGEYVTSMEMAGASVSVCALDTELKRLLEAPAHTASFVQV